MLELDPSCILCEERGGSVAHVGGVSRQSVHACVHERNRKNIYRKECAYWRVAGQNWGVAALTLDTWFCPRVASRGSGLAGPARQPTTSSSPHTHTHTHTQTNALDLSGQTQDTLFATFRPTLFHRLTVFLSYFKVNKYQIIIDLLRLVRIREPFLALWLSNTLSSAIHRATCLHYSGVFPVPRDRALSLHAIRQHAWARDQGASTLAVDAVTDRGDQDFLWVNLPASPAPQHTPVHSIAARLP